MFLNIMIDIYNMPDISMCSSNTCPLKESCYRFTATPNHHWQSYASFSYDEETKDCKHYWNNKEYKKEQEHGKNN